MAFAKFGKYSDAANTSLAVLGKLQVIFCANYLVLNHPFWYFLCWDHHRKDIRTFRYDHLKNAKPVDAGFRLRPME